MQRRILVYGLGDKDSFTTEEAVKEYIAEDIFSEEYKSRFRYTQQKEADIIVLSWKGKAYGHLDVQERAEPTPEDREQYPRVKQVYIIRESVGYCNPVRLSDLGITHIQFGLSITEEQFSKIESSAGIVHKHPQ
jgi:hypothetical protein